VHGTKQVCSNATSNNKSTSLYPICTIFSCSEPRSLTAQALMSAMLETLDMGEMRRSSVTVYVAMPPCTSLRHWLRRRCPDDRGFRHHLAAAARAQRAPHLRHVAAAAAVAGAAVEEPLRRRCRRLWQAEEPAVGPRRGRGRHGGAEHGVPGRAGLDVGPVGELLGAAVELAHAHGHGLLPQQPHGRAGWHGHEGEEEVDHVLTCLREHHAQAAARRDEQLHGQPGTAMREKRKSTTSLPDSANTTRRRQPGATSSFMVSGAVVPVASPAFASAAIFGTQRLMNCARLYFLLLHIYVWRSAASWNLNLVWCVGARRATRPCRLISSCLFLQSRRVVQHIYQLHVHQTISCNYNYVIT
jgi:hypothetical protein